MSKIALSGNSLGTGTLTISAPNTNVDRVLSLPDEAGTVVTSATGGGVYSRNNILGTVSESGGVPTGAIIERGSNANGEFVKYADGTMICFVKNETTPVANTLTSSTHTWPVAFVAAPILSCAVDSAVYGTTITAMTARAATTTGYTQTILRSNTVITGLSVIAIGRWF
jgi:hypothetical protein